MYILVGGAAGSFFRYMISGMVPGSFPFGTLAVNAMGCFLIGIAVTFLDESGLIPPEFKMLMITGFLGAFTTFSTFALETVDMIKDGKFTAAFLNLFIQVVLGILLVFLGIFLAQSVAGGLKDL